MGNLGAQKAKRNDTPISAKKDIMGDKTVRVRADLHHIIKIETAKNGGNVKEVSPHAEAPAPAGRNLPRSDDNGRRPPANTDSRPGSHTRPIR